METERKPTLPARRQPSTPASGRGDARQGGDLSAILPPRGLVQWYITLRRSDWRSRRVLAAVQRVGDRSSKVNCPSRGALGPGRLLAVAFLVFAPTATRARIVTPNFRPLCALLRHLAEVRRPGRVACQSLEAGIRSPFIIELEPKPQR